MSGPERRIAWLIGIGVALVYLLLPTRHYYWDGITFALEIESVGRLSPTLLHANHLLYNVLGYLPYAALNSLGLDIRAISVMQAINAVLGGAAAFAIFHILRRVTGSNYYAACLSLLFAFSATWWKFATDANSYIVSALLLLAAFYLLIRGRSAAPFRVAAMHSGAMLMHQLALFFIPVVIVGLYYQLRDQGTKHVIVAATKYLAACGFSTLAVYYFCYYLEGGSVHPAGFLTYVSSYSSGSGGFTFDVLNNLEHTLRGHIRLFAGGRFNFFEEVAGFATISLLAALLIAVAALAVRIVKGRKEFGLRRSAGENTSWPPAVIMAIVWIAPYLIFCFFFYPQDTFHRLIYFPAIIILIGGMMLSMRFPNRGYRLALFTFALASANFLFLIYPYSSTRDETPLAMAERMQGIWSERTLVFYEQFTGDDTTLKYFNRPTRWQKLPADAQAAEAAINSAIAAGDDVWLETTAIKRFEKQAERGAKLAQQAAEEHKLVDPAYDLRLVRLR